MTHPVRRKYLAGQTLVFFALVLVAILVLLGLATDAAIVFWNRADLSSRADAAALAGGAELPNTNFATMKAYEYLALHNITPANHQISISFRQIKVPNDVIHVELRREVPLAFMSLLGFDRVTVQAEAEVYASQWSGEQTWTMFRGGPGRSGNQPCNGLDAGVQSLQYEFGFRWNLQDGANHRSTPATFQDSRLFNGHTFLVVGSNDNNFGDNKASPDGGAKVYAFDTVTGKTLWLTNLGATKVRSSPLIAIVSGFNDGYPVVYINGHNGRVYALDARDGHILWTSGNNNDDFEGDDLYRSSPALVDGYIYTATSRGNVYKFDARTGQMIWRSTPFPPNPPGFTPPSSDPNFPYPNPNVPADWVTTGWGVAPGNTQDYWGYSPIYATVNVVTIPELGKQVIFLASHGGKTKKTWDWGIGDYKVWLFAIDAATGKKIWVSNTPMGGNNRDSAAVGKVDTNHDGAPDQWRVFIAPTDGYLYAFNALNGNLIWQRYTGFGHHRSDPVLYCDVVFGGNERGVWALTAADGYSIWDCTDSDGAGVDQVNPYCNTGDYSSYGERLIPGGVKSAPAIVDGIIMVGANRTHTGGAGGSMWALEARTGRSLGVWDTTAYNPGAGYGLLPPRNTDYTHYPPSWSPSYNPQVGPLGNKGDVRSGVVVADDFNAYFGSNDGGLYQVFITAVLVIIK